MGENWRAIERAGRVAGLEGDLFGTYLHVALDVFDEAVEREGASFETFNTRYFEFLRDNVFSDERVLDVLREANVDGDIYQRFRNGTVPAALLRGDTESFEQSECGTVNQSTGNFYKVRCRNCDNKQTVFGKATTEVACAVCGDILAQPTGGEADIEGKVVDVVAGRSDESV